MAFLTTAAPASAAINRQSVWTLTGTDCHLMVGGYMNPSRYPGTASQVACASRHTIQVRNELWYRGTSKMRGAEAGFDQAVALMPHKSYYGAWRTLGLLNE